MDYDVFFFEAFSEEAQALREQLPAGWTAGFAAETVQESGIEDIPAELISIRTQSILPLSWASRMRALVTRSTGYDHVRRYREQVPSADFQAGSLPLYCHRAVAEQALLLLLALLRRLPQQTRQFERFERSGLSGREMAGLRLLVVGVGNIGSELARLARNCGMQVRGVDLVERWEDIDYCSIDEGLPWAEAVACCMNLTDENRAYFDADRLSRMGRGSILVNVARGELSPLDALADALESGQLGGLGLDVYEDEPGLGVSLRSASRQEGWPHWEALQRLRAHPNHICTPHNAFNTRESVQRKAAQTIEQFVHFRQQGRLCWTID